MSHPDPMFDPDNSYEDDIMDNEEVYEMDGVECGHEDNYDDYNDDMDGDFDSAMRDAGFGTDEDYGDYGNDTPMYDDYYGGE